MEELVGMKLRHKNFGECVVLSCQGDYLAVQLHGGTATFIVPDVFYGGLSAIDPGDKVKIERAIENWKKTASAEQLGRFERYYAKKEQERKIEEEIRRKKEEEQRAKRLEERRQIERIIASWPVLTWKHITVLVLACTGALFGLLGTIFCLVNCGVGTKEIDLFFAFYVILGFGGVAVSLVEGFAIFFRRFFGKMIMIFGLLLQVGLLIESIVMFQEFGLIQTIFQPEMMQLDPKPAVQMLFIIFACITLVVQAVFALFAGTHKKLSLEAICNGR